MLDGLLAVDGASQTAEMRVRHADGSWRWVEAIGQNLLHDSHPEFYDGQAMLEAYERSVFVTLTLRR